MSLAAWYSAPSRPPQKTYVCAPSSAARSMLRMTLRRANRRTERSLDVKPPSLKTGCEKRLVVTIGTTSPGSSRAALNRAISRSRSPVSVPNGIRSSSWNDTPHAPSSASRWTVSTGSMGARVAEPNGSLAGQPTVQRPNENLSCGDGEGPSPVRWGAVALNEASFRPVPICGGNRIVNVSLAVGTHDLRDDTPYDDWATGADATRRVGIVSKISQTHGLAAVLRDK